MQKRIDRYCGALFLVLCMFYGSNAVAEQFSYMCKHAGVRENSGLREYFTFDSETKRVIAYGIGVQGRIVNAIFKGQASAISPDEIKFDLITAFDKFKVGDFTLNRKEGWMSASQPRGADEARDSCRPTPTRSVMDLWLLFQVSE